MTTSFRFGFVKPMLAKTYEWSGGNLPQGYVAETKLDGHRIQIVCHPFSERAVCYSRYGRTEKFPHWIPKLPFPSNTILDGELVAPQGEARAVSHLRTADPDLLELVLFDVLSWDGAMYMLMPYRQRREALEGIQRYLHISDPRVKIVTRSALGEEIETFVARILEHGGEGVILKQVDSVYRPGYRGNDWLKIKSTFTIDVIITGCDAPPTIWRVHPGHIDPRTGVVSEIGELSSTCENVGLTYGYWCRTPYPLEKVTFPHPETGELVSGQEHWYTAGQLGITGSREEMQKHVGKVAEVKAYGQFPGGALRHPVFLRWRDDKRQEDCTFQQ